MKKVWRRVVGGLVLILIGLVWVLQGSGATGHSGGMNGKSQWAGIGAVVAVAGLALLVSGAVKARTERRR